MRFKGKVIKWQNDKGFGFIEPINGMLDLFFHEIFLLNQSRRPVVGDEVSFEITTNPEGKQRAERILFRGERDPRKSDKFFDVFYSSLSCVFLICIGGLVFLKKLDPIILILYLLLSLIAFLLYRQDKIKAKNDEWRTPENKLHFFSLIGGWPGALIAQRRLRHKSRKQSFLVVFYITVVLNISAISFYSYLGSNFLSYDLILHKFNQLTHEFSKKSQNKPNQKQKGPVYSWTNKEGKTVYSNVGFPSDETYRDGRIERK
ncbi:MAG: uncharacterized membrane protein YsdA (DUF1294 family)/cold shock CspA family protein [Desulforhopalus sp.]|jgi:uncharacterized membrane protein YsdA (DUF1294 family)/cold shock CspA family protein